MRGLDPRAWPANGSDEGPTVARANRARRGETGDSRRAGGARWLVPSYDDVQTAGRRIENLDAVGSPPRPRILLHADDGLLYLA